MTVNWRVRCLNPNWWASILPAIALCIQAFAACLDIKIDFGDKTDTILAAVDSLFVVLTLAGVTNDPTVSGWSDSQRALSYKEPYGRDVNADGIVDEAEIDELLRRLGELDTKVSRT